MAVDSVVGLTVVEERVKEAMDDAVSKVLFVSARVLGLGMSPVVAPPVVLLVSARVLGLPPVKAREVIDAGGIPKAVVMLAW